MNRGSTLRQGIYMKALRISICAGLLFDTAGLAGYGKNKAIAAVQGMKLGLPPDA